MVFNLFISNLWLTLLKALDISRSVAEVLKFIVFKIRGFLFGWLPCTALKQYTQKLIVHLPPMIITRSGW